MGTKRKNDSPPVKLKSKKQRKKRSKSSNESTIIRAKNKFDALPSSENGSDSSVIFDFESKKRDPEIHLVNSDSDNDDGILIVSDKEEPQADIDTPSSEEKTEGFTSNELAKNQDFIEFGFSSSDDEVHDQHDYSDDGVISNDEAGDIHSKSNESLSYAWVKDHDHSKQKEIADWLTMEMKDFVNYISPSKEEILTRNRVISQLKENITRFWPETEVHVFGSSATDLYLPGSDIDMVVISSTGDYEHRSRLYQLSSFLRNKKLAKNIEVIAKAKVPIIKFIDPASNIHVDISFERSNGIEAAKRIRKWLESTPGLREMVLVVKQFLRSRKLNNVHVGGLGGYSTIILCYHFLKLHPRLASNNMSILDNLGSLLIEFFELYGRNFSYDNLIIAIDPETDVPRYLHKKAYPILNTSRNPFAIIIQDPSDPTNNITRSSYNLRDLKKAFGGAFQLLVDKCYSLNTASYKQRIGQLILGDIIKFKGKERNFEDERDQVINDALINHNDEEDESDGANGNDKYYFSDMTDDSEGSTFIIPEQVSDKPKKSSNAKISELMGLKVSESEGEQLEEDNSNSSEKRKSNLDKEIRRDYWKQKGLDI